MLCERHAIFTLSGYDTHSQARFYLHLTRCTFPSKPDPVSGSSHVSLSLVLLTVCMAFSSDCFGADWLQFQGPNASGVTNDSVVPESWGEKENLLWQTDIPGAGWSSPIVVNGKLFVTTAITDGPQNPSSDYRWEVLCLDAKTGKVLWTKTALEGKPRLETHRDNTYASETPVSDGKCVVAYFGMMGLFCYELDGASIWKKDLGLHPMAQDRGTASSPTILDGKVFVQVDNEESSFVVAIDIRNGDLLVVGRSGRGGTSFFAIHSGTDEQLAAARGGDSASLVAWNNREFGPHRASPLIVDGMIYLPDGRGGKATIVDSAMGVMVTQGRIPEAGEFRASPWSSNGRIHCLDASGQTFVFQPSRTLDVVAKNVLPTADNVRFWSTPALADGMLFIRSSKTLYAIGSK